MNTKYKNVMVKEKVKLFTFLLNDIENYAEVKHDLILPKNMKHTLTEVLKNQKLFTLIKENNIRKSKLTYKKQLSEQLLLAKFNDNNKDNELKQHINMINCTLGTNPTSYNQTTLGNVHVYFKQTSETNILMNTIKQRMFYFLKQCIEFVNDGSLLNHMNNCLKDDIDIKYVHNENSIKKNNVNKDDIVFVSSRYVKGDKDELEMIKNNTNQDIRDYYMKMNKHNYNRNSKMVLNAKELVCCDNNNNGDYSKRVNNTQYNTIKHKKEELRNTALPFIKYHTIETDVKLYRQRKQQDEEDMLFTEKRSFAKHGIGIHFDYKELLALRPDKPKRRKCLVKRQYKK